MVFLFPLALPSHVTTPKVCTAELNCTNKGSCTNQGICNCPFLYDTDSCANINGQQLGIIIAVGISAITATVLFIASSGIFFFLVTKLYKKLKVVRAFMRNKRLQRSTIAQQLWMAEMNKYSSSNPDQADIMMQITAKLGPTSWLINPKDIQLRERIGSGSFGDVYMGYLRGSTQVAVKTVKGSFLLSDSLTKKSDKISDFMNEITLWSTLKHPNIVTFMGACLDNDTICIVSEYMVNRTLVDHIGQGEFSWQDKVRICLNIAQALSDMHSRNPPILHRDIKPQNVLLDANLVAKLSDFGLSKIFVENANTQTVVGTPLWMAPEVIRGERYGTGSDVYSLAILMWQLLMDSATPQFYSAQSRESFDSFQTQFQIANGARPIVPSVAELVPKQNFEDSQTSKTRLQHQQPSSIGASNGNSSKDARLATSLGKSLARKGSSGKTFRSIDRSPLLSLKSEFNVREFLQDMDITVNNGEDDELPEEDLSNKSHVLTPEEKQTWAVSLFVNLMMECWAQDPRQRPSTIVIAEKFHSMMLAE